MIFFFLNDEFLCFLLLSNLVKKNSLPNPQEKSQFSERISFAFLTHLIYVLWHIDTQNDGDTSFGIVCLTEKCTPCLAKLYFKFLRCFLHKFVNHQTPDLLFVVLYVLAFMSADRYLFSIHKFLELHSKYLPEKKKICHEFSFFNRFTQITAPHKGQNLLGVTSFLLMLP